MNEHEVDMSTYTPLSESDRLPSMAELGSSPEYDTPTGRTPLDDAQAQVSIEDGELVIDVRERLSSKTGTEQQDHQAIESAKQEINSFRRQQAGGVIGQRLREIGGNSGLV